VVAHDESTAVPFAGVFFMIKNTSRRSLLVLKQIVAVYTTGTCIRGPKASQAPRSHSVVARLQFSKSSDQPVTEYAKPNEKRTASKDLQGLDSSNFPPRGTLGLEPKACTVSWRWYVLL